MRGFRVLFGLDFDPSHRLAPSARPSCVPRTALKTPQRTCLERADKARALAYRLYSLAERKRWTEEAHAYNILVTSWPQIRTEAARLASGAPEQTGFGFSGDEAP